MAKKSSIGAAASAKTREQFKDELASLTTFPPDEMEAMFPEETDREELKALLEIVDSAKDENEKKKALIDNINKYGGAILKITKKISTGGLG